MNTAMHQHVHFKTFSIKSCTCAWWVHDDLDWYNSTLNMSICLQSLTTLMHFHAILRQIFHFLHYPNDLDSHPHTTILHSPVPNILYPTKTKSALSEWPCTSHPQPPHPSSHHHNQRINTLMQSSTHQHIISTHQHIDTSALQHNTSTQHINTSTH